MAARPVHSPLTGVRPLVLTVVHLAGAGHAVEALFGTGRGHLALGMLGLRFALAGLLHVGTRDTKDELDDGDPAAAASAGLR